MQLAHPGWDSPTESSQRREESSNRRRRWVMAAAVAVACAGCSATLWYRSPSPRIAMGMQREAQRELALGLVGLDASVDKMAAHQWARAHPNDEVRVVGFENALWGTARDERTHVDEDAAAAAAEQKKLLDATGEMKNHDREIAKLEAAELRARNVKFEEAAVVDQIQNQEVLANRKQMDQEALASAVAALNTKHSKSATGAAEEQKILLDASVAEQKKKKEEEIAKLAVAEQQANDVGIKEAAVSEQTKNDQVAAVLAKQKQKDEETLASTVAELNIKDSEMATAAAEEQKKMLDASAAAQKTKDDDAAAQVAAEQAILLHDSVARQTQTDREDTAAALALQTRDDEEERVEAVADQKKVDGAAMAAAAIVQSDLVCSDIGGKPDGRLLEAARSVDRRHPGCYDSACEIAGGPGCQNSNQDKVFFAHNDLRNWGNINCCFKGLVDECTATMAPPCKCAHDNPDACVPAESRALNQERH
eukprot:CAMPEP_0179440212 /NCGR_PEP_ID=MMETSP0799-20121207/23804_1 /TAXON_ID=46947 /ORGANISM="Geminigera cryophila, Strain CCMP2564" /LENGTH=478 /DNA_ID=CAMNT_0021223321 /DNA_START=26 /DNA_END=1462 /DNA_ORIENTATION=-